MHPETYRLMAEVEERHWWFRARRDITGADQAPGGRPFGVSLQAVARRPD